MERSMLSGFKLGQEFWEKAVETACYLVNRSINIGGQDSTRGMHCKKISLSHLRAFGCDAYVHVPKEKKQSWVVNLKSASLLDIRMV